MTVGITKLVSRHRPHFARAKHHLALDQYVLHLAPVRTAIHPNEAANRAGDRAQEFDPGNSSVARGRGDQYPARPATAFQRYRIDRLDLGQRLAEPHHHAGDPAVPDDEVGPKPQCHHRNLWIERFEICYQVGPVGRFEQRLRRPARLEPHQRRERGVRL